MRVSFITVLPAIIALASWTANVAQAQPGRHINRPDRHGPDRKGPGSSYPREFLDDEMDFGLEAREFFIEDLTTRELIDELTDRLERRGNVPSKIKQAIKPKKTYGCPYCGAKYDTPELAKACATKPQIMGGCKVTGEIFPVAFAVLCQCPEEWPLAMAIVWLLGNVKGRLAINSLS